MSATAATAPGLRGVAGARSSDAGAVVRQLVDSDDGAEWSPSDFESMPNAELLAVQRKLGALRRRVDTVLAVTSAVIDERSRADDGAAGFAREEGFPTAGKLVADSTGGTTSEANRLIQVGKTLLEAARPEQPRAGGVAEGGADGGGVDGGGAAADGEAGPRASAPEPKFRVLAAAVAAGRLSVDSANAVAAMLTRVADVVEPDVLEQTERRMVDSALTLPCDRLAAVLRQCEAHLNVTAARQREEARREARYLHIFENREGVTVIDGRLDPETAAPIKAAIDAMVGDVFRRRRDELDAGHVAVADERSAPQIRADSLADLAKHCLGCAGDNVTLPKVTVVVRTGLEELQSGEGLGQIDGFDQPVTVGTLRRMAADAEVIPMVLGAESEVLDIGRKRRLFTPAQKLALVERDGGCAWCHAPPSYTEAHHIRWWYRDNGPTDLDNGVLLCTSCHHRIHRDNWDIEVRGSTVWFTPPATVDRQRRPVIGGRARYEYRDAA